MKVTPILTTFNRGELSDWLDGRTDVEAYFSGAKIIENFFITPYGGLMRRPGTYYVAATKSNAAARLVSFQFSTKQAYILEFTEGFIGVYKAGGEQVLTGGNPYYLNTDTENSIVYAEEDLFDLQFAQNADTMWIVHPKYKPQKLTRTGDNAWSLDSYAPTADPFTSSDNYPACVAIYEQRLVFANTNTNPQTVYATVSGDFEDMTTGANDDDAIEYTIGSEQVNAIRWLSPGKILLLGTLGAIFSLSSGSAQEPLTPTNVVVKRETSYGTIGIAPKKIGNFVYYVQRNLKTLREIGYSYEIDEFLANDITVLSEHITGNGIVDMDYQQSPFNMLWCVRDDGVICTMTRQIEQKVTGWSRQITDGLFESVAVIPGDGAADEVWFVVKRYIDGSWVRYVEYLKPVDFGDEQEDAFFVDCGLSNDSPVVINGATSANPVQITTVTHHGYSAGDVVVIRGIDRINDYTGEQTTGMTELNGHKYKVTAPVTDHTFTLSDTDGTPIDGEDYFDYFSGGEVRKCITTGFDLTHLAGKTVSVLGDGAVIPDEVVTANTVTIDTSAGEIHIGLPYRSKLQTMKLEAGSALGTAQGKIKRISKVAIRLYKSLGCAIGTPTKQDDIAFRNTNDDQDTAIPLFTGDKSVIFPSSYDMDAYIVVTQDQPLPLNVIAIMPVMTTNES